MITVMLKSKNTGALIEEIKRTSVQGAEAYGLQLEGLQKQYLNRQDLTDISQIRACLSPLADEVASSLRRHEMKGCVVQVQIKAPSLRVISRQTTLPHYTFLYQEILETTLELIQGNWPKGAPIRALTVGVTGLLPAREAPEQMTLLEDDSFSRKKRERLEKLESAIDSIRKKHGNQAISFGLHPPADAPETDEE